MSDEMHDDYAIGSWHDEPEQEPAPQSRLQKLRGRLYFAWWHMRRGYWKSLAETYVAIIKAAIQ